MTFPLTVQGVSALREKGTAVPTGVAPATSSDMFKSPVGGIESGIFLLDWSADIGLFGVE